jgi:hypothetical protein
MNTRLQRRVTELESAALARMKRPIDDASSIHPDVIYQLTRKLALLRYSDWRHECLSLEELLALARDDDARAQATPATKWAPGLCQIAEGHWVDRSPARAVREIEIRILERDRKVDDRTARSLRDDAHKHFFAKAGPDAELSRPPPLTQLPVPIDLDQRALLASALKKCPRREELSLEEQLELKHEDHRRDLVERAKPRTYPPGIKPPLPGLDALRDTIHQQRVIELQRLIRERDASR